LVPKHAAAFALLALLAAVTTAPLRAAIHADTGRVQLVVAAEGNEARYRVREQLARIDFPSDAIGRTARIEGGIVIEPDGRIVAASSRFVIDLASLQSDADSRDNYLRRRTLQTDSFPSAVFVPGQFHGVTFPLATSGELKFHLQGDMTVRGVTRPVTWEVTARLDGNEVVGRATTRFTFAEFQLDKPRVASVLSVEDDIRLEYDFRLVPGTPPPAR
jgi:polyisoprenoid-binding protein YceI